MDKLTGMAELIRPSTVLPAERSAITFLTSDGLKLIGEIARPIQDKQGVGLLCLHPLPTHGGMMDSHIYKKAANRLPQLAGINVIRFNTRGTRSEQGVSEGHFGEAITEKEDVFAAINYSIDQLGIKKLWVSGWSFGSDLALKYARDKKVMGLILLSPPLRYSTVDDLAFWGGDGRSLTALIPEFDDFLKPDQAKQRFAPIPQIEIIAVKDGKHLWLGEPFVHRVLSEIVKVIAPERLPLPLEI
jgi:alpha/beta superfamily hydrolase